jgi:hypothetical protein
MDEKYFKKFANIHTIEDVLKAKEILKEIYFSEDIDVIVKISILTTLSEFVTKEDMSFYIEVSQKAFNNENLRTILIILEHTQSAFYYIKQSQPFKKEKDIFWLKELQDKSIIVMKNRIELFYHLNGLNILRSSINLLDTTKV